jgi:hypothetical protein
MPLIDIPTESIYQDQYLVWSIMLHPQNEEHRKEFLSVVYNKMLFDIDLKIVTDRAVNETKYGVVAGNVLNCLFNLVDANVLEPSLRKAFYIVQHDFSETTTHNGEKIACSDMTLREAWKKFKSVAHLWAAYDDLLSLLGIKKLRGSADNNNKPPEELFKISIEMFPLFLAASEQYRKFGESYVSSRDLKPVIDPGNTWKIHPSYPLPEVKLTNKEITPWMRNLLENYTHRDTHYG